MTDFIQPCIGQAFCPLAPQSNVFGPVAEALVAGAGALGMVLVMVPAVTLAVATGIAGSTAGALTVAAVGAALAIGAAEAVFAVASGEPELLFGSSLFPQPQTLVRIARAAAIRIVFLMSSP